MPEQDRRFCWARHQYVGRSEQDDPIPARVFLCARCDARAVVCSRCDRGQIYCVSGDCARQARREAQRAAGRRYQLSRPGRLSHAERVRRYRARQKDRRQKNVTHQGSPTVVAHDRLTPGLAPTGHDAASPGDEAGTPEWRCQWCNCRCLGPLRWGFLRRHGLRRDIVRHNR
jgi:hypothetical protein